ncbi:MAG: citrate lyase acyl carrier protein [Sedimentibacter sp.]|uniref:citrate lyase acyl carrier protein n=1 Tax=Sedimentibacter sp. TaxID=1960295 RepID=UPI003158B9DF
MEIKRSASAGTLESSDILVQVEPYGNGIEIELQSVVMEQFGDDIERTVREVLKEFNVTSGKFRLKDRGAVECVIRARVETAVKRAEGADNQ